MDNTVLRYYSFTILLMSFVGLSPYQNTKLRWLLNSMITFMFIVFVIGQLRALVSEKLTLVMILKYLIPMVLALLVLSKYVIFWQQSEIMKTFVEKVKFDWNRVDNEELRIIKEYAGLGKRYTIIFALFTYPSTSIRMLSHVASEILDIITPLNKSRLHTAPIPTNYFIDEQKYLVLIVLYQDLTLIIGGIIFIATESLFIMLMQHNVSLFKIACYHIKVAVSEGTVSSISQDLADCNSKRCLINAVLAHKKAAKFAMDLKAKFQISYSFLLVFGVISLSVNFFLLSEAVCLTHDLEELMMSLLFSITELVYMFYINFLIQQLLDHADSIVIITYNTNWYKTSVSIQKMLLMIMLRCSEPLDFTLFGFYCASIEGFSTIVKNCMSYFMMMSSLEY
ncbi:uncharacterized protein LOC143345655 [Colletes latitarsis]|uniref:uncharacterized protein LOC143345655 n=1 Tax=Colletes latitarsis TaxID=2605962 RepID=UPI00403549F6